MQAIATDADLPPQTITYSLSESPAGVTIDELTGEIKWTPTEAEGPGVYDLTVVATDSEGATDEESFQVTVNEVNVAPVLADIPDQTVEQNSLLQFTASATDADLPANTLTYGLSGTVPDGLTIDPTTGTVSWTPTENTSIGEYEVIVTVSDGNGGSDMTTATVTVNPTLAGILLFEGEDFAATHEESIEITADTRELMFKFAESFDNSDTVFVNDAFEAALVDADGNSLVHTFNSSRDSFFNLTEDEFIATGVNTIVDGSTVKLDLSHIAAGTTAKLVFRLVNNDSDTQTQVRITELGTTNNELNTPVGASFAAQAAVADVEVDFVGLTDVTGSLQFDYAQTSFDAESSTLYSDVQITNNANHPIDGPFLLVVHSITDPNVVVVGSNGATPDGDRYYLIDDLSGTNTIQPGASTLSQTLEFFNPNGEQFGYELSVLAQPNTAPEFVSTPNIEGEVGVEYTYQAEATDADNDVLAYELMAGPDGLTIDAETGLINWTPELEDIGTHSVIVEVADGRGGRDMQQYDIEVLEDRPNRPPVILSTPVVETYLSPDKLEATGNLVANGDFSEGNTGFTTEYDFSPGNILGEGTYDVVTDPQAVQRFAASYGDFTTGSGNMLAINGSTTLGDIVWEQTISVSPGQTYDFAAAISTMVATSPGLLQFTVNGETIGDLVAPAQTAEWVQLFATWESASATSATIRIVNANDAFVGNDFALDDIYFGGPRFSDPTYQYQVEAIDPDLDPINYALVDGPIGMQVDADTGLISWSPTAEQVGTHTVIITADDGRGGTATQEYQLRVFADPTNTAPVIVSDPVEDFFIPGFANPASGNVTPQRISLDLGSSGTFDRTVSITLPDDAARFADIVLTVDESGSMAGEQAFVAELIPLLDEALKAQGVGADAANPNRFAVVGFGGGRDGITVGHFLNQDQPTRYTLYGPDNEVVAEGQYNEVVPEELLNLQLPNDGRYVLVVEAADPADLAGGIDIGIEGQFGDGVRSETLVLNEIVNDRITQPGQPVEYSFSLSTPGLLYFDSLEKDSRVQWTLVGPAGTLANQINFEFSDVRIASPVYEAVAGEYTLTIDSDVDVPADYQFRLINLLEEPLIESGETVTGEFVQKNETFAYRFDVTEGQEFEFVNTITAANGLSRWRLVDATGAIVTLPGNVTFRNLGVNQAPFALPAAGEYYLLMEAGQSPFDGTNAVRVPSQFEFTVTVTDPAPPTAIALGETVNGTINFVGDFVEYSFTLDERTNLYFDSLTQTGISWQLSGPAGTTTEVRFDRSDSFDNTDPVLNLVAGDYTLRVDSNGFEGPFAFRLLDLSEATSIEPGTEFSGELTVPNETDMYKFSASAGDEFFVNVVAASGTGNTLYRIYDQYGRELNETRSLTDLSSFVIPFDGEYTLLVEGRQSNVDADTYTLNIVPVATTTQPLTFNTVNSGSLTTPGASAEYTFTLAADRKLYFDSLTNDSAIVWSLAGPRGVEIDSLRFDQSDSFSRTDVMIDARAGEWTLSVAGIGDAIGDFRFALLDLDDPAQSTPVTPAPGAANPSVTITPTAGLDPLRTEVFRFTADAGDEFSLVTNVTGTINSFYRLVSDDGLEVTRSTNLSSDRLNQVLTSGGDYLLLVEPLVNNAEVDDWSIDINFVQNNGVTTLGGTPLAPGATITGDLATAGQVDEYTFTVTQRGNWYFDSLTDSSSIRWSLNGPTGTVVANRTFSTTDSFNQANVAFDLVPGDYQIQVSATSGTPGAYGFRMQNLATATAITPGTAFGGDLTPANETDLYQFDVVAGETFYFDVESASDVTNTQYKLIDPFGRRVFTSNRLSDFGLQQLDFDGTYTLLVEGWRANTGVDTYMMNVSRVPTPVPAPLVFGETITGSFPTLGETAEYEFSLNDYTQVHFDSLTNSGIYNWTLVNEVGTVVNARRFDRTDSFSVVQSVIELTPGDYRLTIAGVGEAQDFAFRLLDIADATAIGFDTPVTSTHPANRSTNVFTFDADAGDQFFFDAQTLTGLSTSTSWRLFDPYANEIFEQRIITNAGPLILDQAGTYTILVEGLISDDGVDGEFVFEVVALGNVLNPSTPVALVPGEVVSGEIAKKFETDVYALNLAEDALVYFDSLTNDTSLNWTLTNAAGRVLINAQTFNRTDSTGNTSPVISLDAGDYTVSVSSAEIEPYSFRLLNLADAPTIVPGVSQSGTFAAPNQTDVYQFDGSEGDSVYLDVVTTDNSNSTFRLVDGFGAVVAGSTRLVDINSIELPRTGPYYLLLEPFVSATTDTAYEINVVPVVRTESTLTFGDTVTGEIAGLGDTSEFSFSLPQRSSLYFDSLTDATAIVWTLTGPGGSIVTNRRFDASDSFSLADPVLRELPAGDYTLTVDGTSDAVGTFSFRLLDIDAAATPIVAGTSVEGELTIPNETDVYQFTASAGDVILVDVLAADDTANTLYRVYDSRGFKIYENRDLIDGELPPLTATGTYTLLVEGWRANTGVDTYQFDLLTTSTRTVAIDVGDTVTDSIATPGERVAFTFDVAADGFLYFDSLTNEAALTWSLSGPTGEIVTGRQFTRTDSSSFTAPVFEARAGSYTLTVDGNLDTTSTFAFTLSDVATGTPVTLPATVGETVSVSGTLDPGGETQIFRFDAAAGDSLSFDSVAADNALASYRVVDPFGRTVFTETLNRDETDVTLAFTGTYSLVGRGTR